MKHLFIVVLAVVSCTVKKPDPTQQANAQTELVSKATMYMRTIKAAELKTGPGYSTPVISKAQKFIIPVPAFGAKGELLIYPEEQPKAGQPILDYKGNPIGERGIVFFNEKDQSWQAAPGDGQSVIIINEVTQKQAEKLYHRIYDLQLSLDELSITQLKQVLDYAKQELELKDMYNSTRSFIQEKMTPVSSGKRTPAGEDDVYGFKKRDDRDVNQAIYIPGAFLFEGPAASPQQFTRGGVIIEQNGTTRGIQPGIFMRTYTLADGSRITSVAENIKSQMAD
ncbi:hypothetical protein [Fibrella aquatilis]|uniref:Uncharacterized protein n=1 Tax=Fibrella aquatilis TaxID=2817059 RepID=A0A939G9I0_9BACT|nr:hypothetical protein [Fibrella aquatilis]MBO0932541.1 hypothetical protein [Fibrella aquatilis]